MDPGPVMRRPAVGELVYACPTMEDKIWSYAADLRRDCAVRGRLAAVEAGGRGPAGAGAADHGKSGGGAGDRRHRRASEGAVRAFVLGRREERRHTRLLRPHAEVGSGVACGDLPEEREGEP